MDTKSIDAKILLSGLNEACFEPEILLNQKISHTLNFLYYS